MQTRVSKLLLGILDKATLTLGDNRRVDLSQTIIFMTSNLGGVEITELMTGGTPKKKERIRWNRFNGMLARAIVPVAIAVFSSGPPRKAV